MGEVIGHTDASPIIYGFLQLSVLYSIFIFYIICYTLFTAKAEN